LAKKKLGSKSRIQAKLKVARIHAKISDCRTDKLHKLSRKLINENHTWSLAFCRLSKPIFETVKLQPYIRLFWGFHNP
jgi:hypothetical protein